MTRIIVDAGHGGADAGAVNGQKYEKDATLIMAKKVTNRLRNAGFEVVMTRNDDRALTLQRRCDVSNQHGGDAFISIHCNSATNKNASGVETWRYSKVGALTKALAANVQAAMIAASGARDRGVKENAFYVLKNTKAPAVLLEIGFISNDAEAEKIFSTEYQNLMADAIVEGVKKTFAG